MMLGVLVAGSVVLVGGPALAQEATTSTIAPTTAQPTTSTTVNDSIYDDDWYHAYYCWIVARYGDEWNLGTSYECDGTASGTTTTSVPAAPTTMPAAVTTAVIATTEVAVSLLSSTAAAVVANANSWVTLNCTSIGGSADFFQVTATADKGVSVTYPDTTRGYTTLNRDDHLADLELDYTAVKLTVPAGVTGNVTISLHLTYQTAMRDKEKDYTVTLPVAGS